MRPTARLFAAVSQAAPRHLKPGNPTGLTGLLTHPAPRSALIYLYSSVLSKLQQLPESSVYRQATEALTKKRLDIVKAVKPEGYEAWSERMQYRLSEIEGELGEGKLTYDGQRFVLTKMIVNEPDDRSNEFGGLTPFQFIEGAVSAEQRADEAVKLQKWLERNEKSMPRIEPEPLLTLDQ
jgi:NADH dehydrogenase (ubiquinone) 1 alpha subcomplex subunit 5